MMRIAAALFAGLVFGLGLTVAEMINPAKVIAFLDIFGDWDPSLAIVMGAALLVTAVGYRLAWRARKPLLAPRFELPGPRPVDAPLAVGAVLFGIGWGLVGLCPGPALSALSTGGAQAVAFLLAMGAGLGAGEALSRLKVWSRLGKAAPGV